MKDKTKDSAAKARASRAKFNKIKKIPLNPLIVQRATNPPAELDLRSPDEKQGKWRVDPEERRQEKLKEKADKSSASKE